MHSEAEHEAITDRRVLTAIQVYTRENGRTPTIAEISAAVGHSKSTVFIALNRLQRDGYVRREKKRARTLRVTEHYD
jgi:Mn-dependent DtxR family transcriptional regulator